MSGRRVVSRAVMASSGALVLGALGAAPAAASVPAGHGGTTSPLGGVVSAGSAAVTGISSTAGSAVAASGLPKPVKQVVDDVTKTVDTTVRKLTGHSRSGGATHKAPAPVRSTPHHTRHTDAGATSGRTSNHDSRSTAAASHRARNRAAGAVDVTPFAAPGALTAGEAARIAAGHAPAVAAAGTAAPGSVGQGPAVAPHQPATSLPQAVAQDTELALELQLIAGTLAGVVLVGHGYVQRRRIRTTLLRAAHRAPAALPAVAPAAR